MLPAGKYFEEWNVVCNASTKILICKQNNPNEGKTIAFNSKTNARWYIHMNETEKTEWKKTNQICSVSWKELYCVEYLKWGSSLVKDADMAHFPPTRHVSEIPRKE